MSEPTINIAALTRFKHGALYRAALKFGSQSQLAKRLQRCQTQVGRWCNLKDYPAYDPELDARLLLATGKTWEELWPEKLRRRIDERAQAKDGLVLVTYHEVEISRLSGPTLNKLTYEAPQAEQAERAEFRAALEEHLPLLDARTQRVLRLAFGLLGEGADGQQYTYQEIGDMFKVGNTRIAQIVDKGLRMLKRRLEDKRQLAGHYEETSRYGRHDFFRNLDETAKERGEPEILAGRTRLNGMTVYAPTATIQGD